VISFVIAGVVAVLAALCYAELAASVPTAGSAYSYAYATMGEFIAWIIGWDLILEYAVGNIAVAVSWSAYFQTLLSGFGLHLPAWLGTDPRTALQGFNAGPPVRRPVFTASERTIGGYAQARWEIAAGPVPIDGAVGLRAVGTSSSVTTTILPLSTTGSLWERSHACASSRRSLSTCLSCSTSTAQKARAATALWK
jgi:amino acid transporter